MLSKSILKGLVVGAFITGYGVAGGSIPGSAGLGFFEFNAPTSTTTATPHTMLNPEQQSKHMATAKGEQSKNAKTHSENKANEGGSSSQKLNTK
jgi:hypothetical protein